MDIPFTTFHGQLKQLDYNFAVPIMKELFDTCFSAFEDIDEQYSTLIKQGVKQFITAAGSEINFGFRPRRFSGGPGLSPGSYYTLCDGKNYNDYGTLRDELTAYYRGLSGITPLILDPKVDEGVLEYLQKSHNFSDESLLHPLYLYIYSIERETEKNKNLIERNKFPMGDKIAITYGVRQFETEISRVIDLRDFETQNWFVNNFVNLELANEKNIAKEDHVFFMPKKPIENFGDLLPVIVSLETGGGIIFGQAVGHWLRLNGANALVFPSARSNTFNEIIDGKIKGFKGWNMVIYANAMEPVKVNLFGRMATWRDIDHDHIKVQYTSDGSTRGSFSIRGVQEFNLLKFDFEKQIACGQAEYNIISQVTGTFNANLTRAVNYILEQEAKSREIFYNDIDYLSFLNLLEESWKNQSL
jgi:hypothetical protein